MGVENELFEMNMKKAKKCYKIFIGLLISFILLSFLFAQTMEDQTVLQRIFEQLGIYKISILTKIITIVLILLLFLLFLLTCYYYSESKFFRLGTYLQHILPLLLIVLAFVGHINSKNINVFLLSYQKDLGAVIHLDRTGNNIFYDIIDSEELLPDLNSPSYSLELMNCGYEQVSFYIKFVEKEEPHREFIYKNTAGEPAKITMAPRNDINLAADLEHINPDYTSEVPEGEVPKYNIIIYNENDSKMFYTYMK